MLATHSADVIHLPTAYRLERLADCWDDLVALSRTIDPSYDLHEPSFRALDAAGALRIWTARRHRLIGESMWCIAPDPFHAGIMQAQQLSLAVAPEARLSTVAICLIRMATRALDAEGVRHQVVSGPRTMGTMAVRLGFHAEHTTYLKDT